MGINLSTPLDENVTITALNFTKLPRAQQLFAQSEDPSNGLVADNRAPTDIRREIHMYSHQMLLFSLRKERLKYAYRLHLDSIVKQNPEYTGGELRSVIHNSGVRSQWRTQNFFRRGGVQQIQLRTEDREKGDLGAVAP